MAFITIEGVSGGKRPPLHNTVNVSLSPNGGRPAMWVRVARNVVDDLGWQPGDRFDILFGENEDFGKAMLKRVPNGPLAFPSWIKPPGAVQFATTRLPGFLARGKHKVAGVTYAITGGAIVFNIPMAMIGQPAAPIQPAQHAHAAAE